MRGEVAFDRVEFRYSRGQARGRAAGISFRIAPGETLGIAGATGAGKSTLIKLLLRFYDVTGGAVRVDGHDVRNVTSRGLRRNIGLVSQDVFLFHGTIRENIAYGRPAPPARTSCAAARAGPAHDFVAALPQGYDTLIGERGVKLSGGQRQRLSIARAIVKDAADPDPRRGHQLRRHRDRARPSSRTSRTLIAGRTALDHRPPPLHHPQRRPYPRAAGRRGGEEGTHDDLVAKGGLYADLWHVQSGELASPVISLGSN